MISIFQISDFHHSGQNKFWVNINNNKVLIIKVKYRKLESAIAQSFSLCVRIFAAEADDTKIKALHHRGLIKAMHT